MLDRPLDVRHTAIVVTVAPPVALLAGLLVLLAALSYAPGLFLIGASR